MHRSSIVGFCPKNIPRITLLTGLKLRFNTLNSTGIINNIVHLGE